MPLHLLVFPLCPLLLLFLPSFLEQHARETQARVPESENEGGIARRSRRRLGRWPLWASVLCGGRRRRCRRQATFASNLSNPRLCSSRYECRENATVTDTALPTLLLMRETQRTQRNPRYSSASHASNYHLFKEKTNKKQKCEKYNKKTRKKTVLGLHLCAARE